MVLLVSGMAIALLVIGSMFFKVAALLDFRGYGFGAEAVAVEIDGGVVTIIKNPEWGYPGKRLALELIEPSVRRILHKQWYLFGRDVLGGTSVTTVPLSMFVVIFWAMFFLFERESRRTSTSTIRGAEVE